MINPTSSIGSNAIPQLSINKTQKPQESPVANSFKKHLENADELQQKADVSIQDMLSGKNQDINSVVAQVAKADMSFKLLVGVRNKIIEAYKQTMQMQI